MLENRKVLTAVIGYILGILMGLYCKISIVLFYILIFIPVPPYGTTFNCKPDCSLIALSKV